MGRSGVGRRSNAPLLNLEMLQRLAFATSRNFALHSKVLVHVGIKCPVQLFQVHDWRLRLTQEEFRSHRLASQGIANCFSGATSCGILGHRLRIPHAQGYWLHKKLLTHPHVPVFAPVDRCCSQRPDHHSIHGFLYWNSGARTEQSHHSRIG